MSAPSSPSIAGHTASVIPKREARSIDGGDRHQRREEQPAGRKEIDGAGAHLRQQIAVAAELAVREYADIDLAAGILLDPGGRLHRERIHGMSGRETVAEFPGIVGSHRARDIRHRQPRAAEARKNRSTRYDHDFLPGLVAISDDRFWVDLRASY
jgi:hypothetical protein